MGVESQLDAENPNPAASFLLWATGLAQRVGKAPDRRYSVHPGRPSRPHEGFGALLTHARGPAAWRDLARDGQRPALSNAAAVRSANGVNGWV
jgi:hypothetical protein